MTIRFGNKEVFCTYMTSLHKEDENIMPKKPILMIGKTRHVVWKFSMNKFIVTIPYFD